MVDANVETTYSNISVFYFAHNIFKPLIVYLTQHGLVRTEIKKMLSIQMLIYFSSYTHNHLTIEYFMVILTFS